jgi:hypothetical protein
MAAPAVSAGIVRYEAFVRRVLLESGCGGNRQPVEALAPGCANCMRRRRSLMEDLVRVITACLSPVQRAWALEQLEAWEAAQVSMPLGLRPPVI